MKRKRSKQSRTNKNAIDWTKIDLHNLSSPQLSVFTLKEVATLRRATPTFVGVLIDEGALSAFDISCPPHSRSHYRIPKSAFVAYLREKGVAQNS